MEAHELQRVVDNPPLFAHMCKLPPRHLDAVTLYNPNDENNPAQEMCNEIARVMELEAPPHLLVVNDDRWQSYLSLPCHKLSSYTYGFYAPDLKLVVVSRSLFENFQKREPLSSYVMAHEIGHYHEDVQEEKEVSAVNDKLQDIHSRRWFIKTLSKDISLAIGLVGSIGSAMGGRKDMADGNYDGKDEHGEKPAGYLVTSGALGAMTGIYAALKYSCHKADAERRTLIDGYNNRERPTSKQKEFHADAQATKFLTPEEITDALLVYTRKALLLARLDGSQVKEAEDRFAAEIEQLKPGAPEDEKKFQLAVAMADYSAGKLEREDLATPVRDRKVHKRYERKMGSRKEYPVVRDRIIHLKDIGVFDQYDKGFSL